MKYDILPTVNKGFLPVVLTGKIPTKCHWIPHQDRMWGLSRDVERFLTYACRKMYWIDFVCGDPRLHDNEFALCSMAQEIDNTRLFYCNMLILRKITPNLSFSLWAGFKSAIMATACWEYDLGSHTVRRENSSSYKTAWKGKNQNRKLKNLWRNIIETQQINPEHLN